MLRLLRLPRSFARLFNPVKNRPRSVEKTRFPSKFRESPGIKGQMEEVMQTVKSGIPVSPISETLSKTGKEIKATETILSFRTPTDEHFEGKIRRVLVSTKVTELGASNLQYMKENLFILDQSVESRKNVLLVKELEAFQRAMISNKEAKRRKALQEKDVRVLLGLKNTKDTSVDQLLSRMSMTFAITDESDENRGELIVSGTEGGELSKVEAAGTGGSSLIETTGDPISYTGVIDLTGRTTGRLSFTHLTHRELANYICFNIHKREEALQLFIGSRESSQFDSNLKASLVQKLAILPAKSPLVSDARFKDLLGDLSRCVPALSNKNVCDSLWAVCRLFSGERSLSPLAEHLIHSLCDQVCARISALNAMNLAYVCDGMWRLKLHLPTVVENVLLRIDQLMKVTENMVAGEKEKPIDPWNYNVTTQPSVFHGFEDRTLPKYPLTAPAIEMLTRYLVTYPYFESEDIRTGLMVRCAELVGNSMLNEVNAQTIVSLMRTFGRDDRIALRPQVQSLFQHLAKLLQPFVFSLRIYDSTAVLESTLNAGLYSLSELFKELELSSTTVIHSANAEELVAALKVWARFYYSFATGIDPVVDPAHVLIPKKPILGSVINEYLQLLSSFTLSDPQQLAVAKIFASLGHRLDFHPSLPGIQRLSKTPIYHTALFQLQALVNQTGFLAETIQALPMIMNREAIPTQIGCLLALAHVNAEIDIKGICVAINAEIEGFRSNKEAVPMLWAISALGSPEAETVRKLVAKINFQRLTRIETMLVYQVYLAYKDFLLGAVPDSVIEAGPSLFQALDIYEKYDLPDGVSAERDKLLPGYFVQYYSQKEKTYFEKYKLQCYISDGRLVGMLRMREKHLKDAGFLRSEVIAG